MGFGFTLSCKGNSVPSGANSPIAGNVKRGPSPVDRVWVDNSVTVSSDAVCRIVIGSDMHSGVPAWRTSSG